MTFELFINFNGNCREALDFYSKVFKAEVKNLMTAGEAPADPNYPIAEDEKDLVMYASLKIGDKDIMFMDMDKAHHITIGENITPTLNVADRAEIDRLFGELKEGGEVLMAPAPAFFSPYYAMVKDKFGIIWHILDPTMPTSPEA